MALGGKQAGPGSPGEPEGPGALYLCVFSTASSSRPSSKVASWIRRVASFPEAAAQMLRMSSLAGGRRGLGAARHVPLLTHLDQSLAGHGVPRVDHLPARHVHQRTAEGVLAVSDQAGLELEVGAVGSRPARAPVAPACLPAPRPPPTSSRPQVSSSKFINLSTSGLETSAPF